MKEYRAYLFDADGTLIDTADMIYECFLHTCAEFGRTELSREEIMRGVGIPLRPQMECLLGPLDEREYNRAQEIHMDYQNEIYVNWLKGFEGTAEILEELKSRRKALAVVTSRRLPSLTVYLKHVGIFDYFDLLVTPHETAKHKPDPEPALFASAGLNIAPEKCLFIGDAIFDIKCGSSAGMDTAFVEWSTNHHSDMQPEPTWHLKSWSDLLW